MRETRTNPPEFQWLPPLQGEGRRLDWPQRTLRAFRSERQLDQRTSFSLGGGSAIPEKPRPHYQAMAGA